MMKKVKTQLTEVEEKYQNFKLNMFRVKHP